MTNKDSNSSTSLAGKTALVCGASGGIGQASAVALSRMGARVIALARTETKLKKTLEMLAGPGHTLLACDLNDHAFLHERLSQVLKNTAIEILINNSTGPKGGPLLEAKPEEFVSAFHQHILTSQLLASLVVPKMKDRGYGRIVNVVSTSVRTPIPNLGVSNTIRAATAGWAKTLAGEVGRFGITVNCVLPGFTATDRLSSLLKAAAEKSSRPEAEIAKEWQSTIPMARFAAPEEVANAVAFLASPAAGYITGVALPVDGGRIPAI